MRGGLPTGAGSGRVNGLLVPAGSTSVYDQILGKNAKDLSYMLDTELQKLKTDVIRLGLLVLLVVLLQRMWITCK